jgi:hypothetical protein
MLHSIGDVRTTSLDPEIYAKQLEANRAEPCAYKGRNDLNKHVPKWTYPLVTPEDYDRLSDWIARCHAHGLSEVIVVLQQQ